MQSKCKIFAKKKIAHLIKKTKFMSKISLKKETVESIQNNPKNIKNNIKNSKKNLCVDEKLRHFFQA